MHGKKPRQIADNQWMRIYRVFLGSRSCSVPAFSKDGDFTAWEKKFIETGEAR
jgi:hypothetical protein